MALYISNSYDWNNIEIRSLMWQPITLRIKNLFTHEETEFNFKLNEMILLLGLNEDQEGSNSNGSGKSSILDGLILALTGETYRGINKDEYIRKGQSSCEINLILRHSVSQERFLICREFFIGNKSSILNMFINGDLVKDFQNKNKMKRSAQEFIYDKLGISKEDILNYFIISDGNDSCFLTASDTKQKEVISRFSNYSKIDKIVDKINEDLEILEDEIIQNGTHLQSRIQFINQVEQFIESLEKNSEYEEKKSSIQEQQEELETLFKETQEKYINTLENINALDKEITVLKKRHKVFPNVVDLNKELKNLGATKEELEDEIDQIKEVKSQLAVRSGKAVKCPKCKWIFLANDNMTIKELEKNKRDIETLFKLSQDKLLQLHKDIQAIKIEIEVSEEYNNLQNKLKIKKLNQENYVLRLKETEEQIALKKKEILNLKNNSSNQKLIKEQQLRLKESKEEIKDLEEREQELTKKKESLNFHLFAFQKQFRTYICNKTIRTIQDIINYYFGKFNMDMRVMINGYKVLKSGDIREKIEIWVIKNGKERVLFKGLSSGEKSRASLCSVVSINKLLRNSSENGGLDLIALDEFLTGLDAKGCEEVIKILEQSKLTSLIVMHHVEDIHVRNKVFVVKKDNISKIQLF